MPDRDSSLQTSVASALLRRLNLRFPKLFLILALLTLADLIIPDFIPFIDEIGLGLLTMLLATWKNRRAPVAPDQSGNT